MNSKLAKKYKKIKLRPNETIRKGDILVFEYKNEPFASQFVKDYKRTAFIVFDLHLQNYASLQTLDEKGGSPKGSGYWTHFIRKDRKYTHKLIPHKKGSNKSNKSNDYQRLADLVI